MEKCVRVRACVYPCVRCLLEQFREGVVMQWKEQPTANSDSLGSCWASTAGQL